MDWSTFGAFALANFIAAASGGLFKPGHWYAQLNRPAWTPPNWAFPVVWSTLFLMNAAAGAIAWTAATAISDGMVALPFIVYGVSLCFNFAWSALFFGLRRMDLALVDVVFLWMTIAAVLVLFAPLSPLAAGLVAPYLAWVTLAGVLNLRMIQLNPAAASEGVGDRAST
ncbi:MAG: sensory protein TspO [Alphaproteobacteria bacterium]|nr:sensory protein TspO [Alphaproteobacteria bacterium]